ncbi:hypothetical protein HQQ81_09655 [Microbacteriaceae bacterium VKM Ac-2854]|nr:hypothetical protein [Microbacteriaceae bacterium VKM Ac-2854]
MTATPRFRAGRISVVLASALVIVASLAACTPSADPQPNASADATSSAAPTPVSTPTPDPVFVPGGTAEQNKAYFDWSNAKVVAADSAAKGRSFIDSLVAAGFDKAAMEVTPDATSIGLDADSVQFSVKIGEDCLVGQYGPKSGGYHGIVAKPIATGKCLVGQTATIDW